VPEERAVETVGCGLGFEVGEGGADMILQVAVARGGVDVLDEELVVEAGGAAVPVTEVAQPDGGRYHLVRAPAGPLRVAYDARVAATAPPGGGGPGAGAPSGLSDLASVEYLRPSRYCPSDRLAAFALAELSHLEAGPDQARQVATWVGLRLAYDLNTSRPTDGALETLFAGQGACRDFAHLTVALCRALEIPARFAAVYAPGLAPMDFHAVAEARVGDRWEVLDATRLAPRQTLVRIATGRDAADTAFATTVHGHAELTWCEIRAVADPWLPLDDHTAPVVLR
jgi:transglutaminase-like putative cysteine protease